jgi:lysozyme
MNMQYSDAARIALTEASEGCPPTIYLDPVGIPTGGYGHTSGLTASMVGMPVDPDQADIWLRADIQSSVAAVNRYVQVPLTQHQFDACVDFTFNVGAGNFSTSTLLKLINTGDMTGASAQFSRWVFAKGKQLPGLVVRRAAETAWFNTPDGGV